MQHVFLAFFPAGPEGVLSLESGIQSVVGGADDAVVRIQGGGSHLAVRVLRPQGCRVRQRHYILRDGKAG